MRCHFWSKREGVLAKKQKSHETAQCLHNINLLVEYAEFNSNPWWQHFGNTPKETPGATHYVKNLCPTVLKIVATPLVGMIKGCFNHHIKKWQFISTLFSFFNFMPRVPYYYHQSKGDSFSFKKLSNIAIWCNCKVHWLDKIAEIKYVIHIRMPHKPKDFSKAWKWEAKKFSSKKKKKLNEKDVSYEYEIETHENDTTNNLSKPTKARKWKAMNFFWKIMKNKDKG